MKEDKSNDLARTGGAGRAKISLEAVSATVCYSEGGTCQSAINLNMEDQITNSLANHPSDGLKFARRLVSLLPRSTVEHLVKLHRPTAKPHLSNVPDLRDQVALGMVHDATLRAAFYETLFRLTEHPFHYSDDGEIYIPPAKREG